MKKLEISFQTNADQTGLMEFRQLKRTANVAMYERVRKDKSVHSYEVFLIKTVKAGTVFAKGATPVAEDYESYPGKSGFGKYAYSCKTLERANIRYEELIKNQNNHTDANDADAVSEPSDDNKSKTVDQIDAPRSTRGRKAKDRSAIVLPKDKFTIKQLELLNPQFSFALLYQHVRNLLNVQFKIVDTLGGRRGKPTLVYQVI